MRNKSNVLMYFSPNLGSASIVLNHDLAFYFLRYPGNR